MRPMSACRSPRPSTAAALTALLLLGSAGCPASEDPNGPTRLPERLGMTEQQLRAEFGDALRPAKIKRPRGFTEQIMEIRRRTGEAGAAASPAGAGRRG